MKRYLHIIVFVFMSQIIFSQVKEVTITGIITDGLQPLSDVNILIEGGTVGTKTNKYGKYSLNASEGDIIVFTHMGHESVEIITEDIDRTLNIVMNPDIEQLDNVTVIQKNETHKTQEKLFLEYNTNPNLIKTGFGILDKEISGTTMYVIDEKQINPVATNILAALNGKFPGVKISPEGDPTRTASPWTPGAVIYIRGGGSVNYPTPAIYEIDGLVYKDPPLFLDVQNIKRIALLPSFASAARYGNIAVGGIFIINTKAGNFSPKNGESGIYDKAAVRNNDFQNDVIDYDVLSKDGPTYLMELRESPNFEHAKATYHKYLKAYGSSSQFILDCYQYFFNEEEKLKFADDIINTHKGLFENNPIALKALAYIYQVQGRLKKANVAYKDIFIQRPNYSQSYIDLASSYREIEQVKKAAGIYARYTYLLNQGFIAPERDFDAIMNREYKNLLNQEGEKLLSKRAKKKIGQNIEFYNTRLVFEWNDSEAEFELQFVNPKGKFVKIEHSLFADPERIRSQKIAGYTIEEHLIDGSMLGNWQVNAKYLGNKSLTPTYFKVTIYQNYGSESQRKEVKVFKLSIKNINQRLFKVTNTASLVSN